MDKKIIGKEKRRDLRIFMKKPFMLRCQIKKQKELFKLRPKKLSHAENMSVGGMSIELPVLDQGQIDRIINGQDKLILELNIPSLKKPLKVTGKIVWLKKRDRTGRTVYVTGLSFQDLKEKDREKVLLQLVNLCLKSIANI